MEYPGFGQYHDFNAQNQGWYSYHYENAPSPSLISTASANVRGHFYQDPIQEPSEEGLVNALVHPESPHMSVQEKMFKFIFDDNGDEDYSLKAFQVVRQYVRKHASKTRPDSPASLQAQQPADSLERPGATTVELSYAVPHSEVNATQIEPDNKGDASSSSSHSQSLNGDVVPPANAFGGVAEGWDPTNGYTSLIPAPLEDVGAPSSSHPDDAAGEVTPPTEAPQNAEQETLDLLPEETFQEYGPAKYFSQKPHKTLSWLRAQWVMITNHEFAALRPFELLYMFSEKMKRPAEAATFLNFRSQHLKKEKEAGRPVGDGTQGGGSKLAAAAYLAMKQNQGAASTPIVGVAESSTTTAMKERTYAPLTEFKKEALAKALVLAQTILEQEQPPPVKIFLQTVYDNASRKLEENIRSAERQAARKAKKKAEEAAAARAVAAGDGTLSTEDAAGGARLGDMGHARTKKTSKKNCRGPAGAQVTSLEVTAQKENQPKGRTRPAALPVLGAGLGAFQLASSNDIGSSLSTSYFGQMLPHGNILNVVGASVQQDASSRNVDSAIATNRNMGIFNTHPVHHGPPAYAHAPHPRYPIAAAGPSRQPQQAFTDPSPSPHPNAPFLLSPIVDNSKYPFTFSMPHNLPINNNDPTPSSSAQSILPYLTNLPASSPMIMGTGANADFTFQFPAPGHCALSNDAMTIHQASNTSRHPLQHNAAPISPGSVVDDTQLLGSGIWDFLGGPFDFTETQLQT